MIAAELISTIIPPLKTSDSVQRALERMSEFKLYHLAIVNQKQFLGLVAEEELMEVRDQSATIGSLSLSIINPFVFEDAHIYDVIRLFNQLQLSIVPVLDLNKNYLAMEKFGIKKEDANYFLPPYEWHNQQIANWTRINDLQLVNFTPGTRSNADYTFPEMGNSYRTNEEIYQSILAYEKKDPKGLNGFMLLLHIGTDPKITEKFYDKLPELIHYLKGLGYDLVKINELLSQKS